MDEGDEARENYEPPRGARRGWLLAALVFLLSVALPWTSCNDMAPATAAMLYLTGSKWQGQLIGAAMVLAPVLAVFALAVTEARGRWRAPAQTFALALLACGLAVGVGAHGDGEKWVIDAWPAGVRFALRVMLLAPPAAAGAWAFAARNEGGWVFGARWLASFAAAGSTLVWSVFGDRYGFWVGAAGAVGMLLLAPRVEVRGGGPLGARGQRVVLALAGVWLAGAVALNAHVRSKPRAPAIEVRGAPGGGAPGAG